MVARGIGGSNFNVATIMDSGTAAVLGALVGALTTPLSAWVREHFKNPTTRKSDKLRRKRLKKILLLPTKKWRSIRYLADAIGADEEKTKRLLLEIDARKSLSQQSNNWALVARAPFPDDIAQDEVVDSD